MTTRACIGMASAPFGARAARRKSVSLDSGSTPGSPSTSKTGSAAVTSMARLDSSSSASASSSPVRRTVTTCEPGSAIEVRNDSGILPPGRERADNLGRSRHRLAVDRRARPCASVTSDPQFVTLVVIVIGRLGVISPPESSSGATDPFGPTGPAFEPKLITQIRGDTPERRLMSW